MNRLRIDAAKMVTRLVTLLLDYGVFGAMRILLKPLIPRAPVNDHCRDRSAMLVS